MYPEGYRGDNMEQKEKEELKRVMELLGEIVRNAEEEEIYEAADEALFIVGKLVEPELWDMIQKNVMETLVLK